jgi:nanoRNase/pAp phosphatase (c-di-AMP/oligoRNAs hydrolase)
LGTKQFINHYAARSTISEEQQYRLVTRSDFGGLVCAVLLEELDLIDDILFVHPNDMQQGRVTILDTDITTNLPYIPGVYLAFDHHQSEVERAGELTDNHIIDASAPSAAQVVYDYYGGKEKFPTIDEDLMTAVDKADAAQFTMEEVLEPKGWPLLSFIMDPRTGLGRFRGFRIPNYELMMALVEFCHEHTIDEILELPDIKERVDLYFKQEEKFVDQLKRCSKIHDNLIVLDLRDEETIFSGNRFMIYALFPECNISMHVITGRGGQNVVFAVGKSIFDRSSKTDIGRLMLEYGGGGHHAAGTCQIDHARSASVQLDLIGRINSEG